MIIIYNVHMYSFILILDSFSICFHLFINLIFTKCVLLPFTEVERKLV